MALQGKGKGIIVTIGADYNDKDVKRAQADLRRLSGTAKQSQGPMSNFGNTMKNAVGRNLYSVQTAAAGAVAGIAAFAGMMAVEGIQAAAQEEQQLARLQSALENVNQAHKLPEITNAIDKMMYASAVADDELRPAFQTLVTATRDADKAQRLLALAVDISVAKQKDLGTVTTALARATGGSTTALGRLAPGLSDNAKKAGNLEIALSELEAMFGGSAAANVDTFAGRMKLLQIVFDETKEAFGTGFLEGIEESLVGLGTISDAAVGLQPTFEDLGRSVGEVVGQVITLADKLSRLQQSMGIIGEFINPIANTANQIGFLSSALGTVSNNLGLNIVPSAKDAANQLQVMAFTDFSFLRQQLGIVSREADEAARTRTLSIVLQARFNAGQVGMSDYLTRTLDDFFEDVDTATSGATVAPPKDPFKEWVSGLQQSARATAARSKLLAAGIPAAMADGILSDPEWPKIIKGLMRQGRAGIAAYVRAFTTSPAGVEAIGDEVSAIVEAARTRLEGLREQQQEFADIRAEFADTARSFGKLTTIEGDAPVSAEAITENLRQRLGIVRQFASALTKLRTAGLGPSALVDIIQLGPFEGLKYAEAILAGGAATIGQIKQLTAGLAQPAQTIATIGAESVSGTTAAALDQSTNFTVEAGGINITINGEVTAQTRDDIEDAVRQAFRQVGRESRARGRTGVR